MSAMRYVIVSVSIGLLFAAMDGLINANPIALVLYEAYQPMTRASVNVAAGLAIDIVYGFVMVGVFLLLYRSLPGQSGLAKGLSYALIVWFFRVLMSAASSWMLFTLPAALVGYQLVTGLLEMAVLGALLGVFLKPVVENH
jgi:hypothetical protein